QYVLLLSALGGGLGRPRRLGIPSPEGERRMTNAHLKVLHFDLESSIFLFVFLFAFIFSTQCSRSFRTVHTSSNTLYIR
ncbi:hypothetical protein, partial [Duncaniella muris]